MKRIIVLFLSLVLALSLTAQRVLPKPNPPKLVNDEAHLLTPDQVASLEAKLVAYDDSTSNQIVIVTVPTLNGLDPNDYATELGRSWGVGGSEYNNGVVVLVSTGQGSESEGRKVYISAGYGLEGALPDITLKQIIENEMVPNLKAGNYYRAMDEATSALIRAAAACKLPLSTASKRCMFKKVFSAIRLPFTVLLSFLFQASPHRRAFF